MFVESSVFKNQPSFLVCIVHVIGGRPESETLHSPADFMPPNDVKLKLTKCIRLAFCVSVCVCPCAQAVTTIVRVSPNDGSTNGGTRLSISGTGK